MEYTGNGCGFAKHAQKWVFQMLQKQKRKKTVIPRIYIYFLNLVNLRNFSSYQVQIIVLVHCNILYDKKIYIVWKF